MDSTIVGAVLLLIVIVLAAQTLKIVPQQHAWVLERLGRYHRTLTPGLSFAFPFVDRIAYKHILKEIPLEVPSQVCITRDNTQLQVDGVLYFQVTDPDEGVVRFEQVRVRDYAVVADHAALRDRQT